MSRRWARAGRVVSAALALGALSVVEATPARGQEAEERSVEVTPDAGLVDGQTVVVTGAGFEPGRLREIFQCRADAVDETGCDGFNAYFVDVDPDGRVRFEFLVDASIHDLEGNAFDCRSAPGACTIGVGFMTSHDLSAFAALDFDPDAPLLPPVTASVRPTTGLADGQSVRVLGEHLRPARQTWVFQCLAGTRPPRCDFPRGAVAVSSASGTVDVDYEVRETLETASGTSYDCAAAPGRCSIGVSLDYSFWSDSFAEIPITFGARPPTTTSVPTTSGTVAPATTSTTGADTVVAGATTSTPGTETPIAELPRTGGGSDAAARVGLVALGVGALLLAAARSRRAAGRVSR